MLPALFGVRWLTMPWYRWQSNQAAREIRGLLHAMIKPRYEAHLRGEAEEQEDILAAFMQAKDPNTGEPFNEEELVNQVAMLFLAGHETSASALTWASYLLSQSPDVQQRAYEQVLEVVGDRLTLEVNVDGVSVDAPTQPGDIVTLRSGATVAAKGMSFRAISLPADPSKPTTRPMFDELPTAVTLRFLPRGGNLSVTVGTHTRRLYLADKRCDLVACLLQPSAPYAVGDIIPDTALSARLWGVTRGGRTDINTLVWRVRKDLAAAGMEDVPLLERSRGGVRLRLADGARVSVITS
jgi:hypothetical protein